MSHPGREEVEQKTRRSAAGAGTGGKGLGSEEPPHCSLGLEGSWSLQGRSFIASYLGKEGEAHTSVVNWENGSLACSAGDNTGLVRPCSQRQDHADVTFDIFGCVQSSVSSELRTHAPGFGLHSVAIT